MHNSMQMSSHFSLAVMCIFSHSCAFAFDMGIETPLAKLLDLEIELGILDLLPKIITPSLNIITCQVMLNSLPVLV